ISAATYQPRALYVGGLPEIVVSCLPSPSAPSFRGFLSSAASPLGPCVLVSDRKPATKSCLYLVRVRSTEMARVYVGNLDPRVTERELEDEFRSFGVLRSVWVARKPPGFAFVDFDDRRDAQDAIRELDEVTVHVIVLQNVLVPHLAAAAIAASCLNNLVYSLAASPPLDFVLLHPPGFLLRMHHMPSSQMKILHMFHLLSSKIFEELFAGLPRLFILHSLQLRRFKGLLNGRLPGIVSFFKIEKENPTAYY
ncbi:hypothetical protein Taro_022636, partial [Colocasia esculenta]|nr:hypothetical protein [Colocasia esculenta]